MSAVINLEDNNSTQCKLDKEELLTILLDIGNGNEESIKVYPGDSAEELAKDFAQRHSLDYKMKEKLKDHIQDNINKTLMELALIESEPSDSIKGTLNFNTNKEDLNKKFEKWQSEIERNMKESVRIAPSINPLSRKLVESNALNVLPVHERLHMQAVNKQRAIKHAHELCKG
jgi:hypothetical protein